MRRLLLAAALVLVGALEWGCAGARECNAPYEGADYCYTRAGRCYGYECP